MQRIPPFRTLDAFRGYAALWVVMVHACDRFLDGDNLRYLSNPLFAFSIHGQLGVVLFFVISGYCIVAAAHSALYSGKTLGRYAFERGRRIFPPYWIALIVGVFAQLVLLVAESHHWIGRVNHPQEIAISPVYWFANLTLLQSELHTGFSNGVFWSLCYEIAFYAIVGVWLWLAQVIARKRNMAAGQLTLILGLLFTTLASLTILLVWGIAIFPLDLWHQFAFGGILFYLIESNPATVAGYSRRLQWTMNILTLVAVGLSIAFIAFRQVGYTDLSHASSKLRTGLCLGFCLLLAILRRVDLRIADSRSVRPLLWLGASSYSLYLFHPIILPFIDAACRKIGLDGPRYWIAFCIQVAISIPVGRFFYRVVERHFISSKQTKRLVEEHAA